MSLLTDEITKGHARGWSFTPLRGKRPVLPGWQSRLRESPSQALRWVQQYGNMGLRTGQISGVVVIDADKDSDLSQLNLPTTAIVATGGGGWHFYYRCDKPLGNSTGKLGKHIDVRANGGQVVFVGSVHPDTGAEYQWALGMDPESTPLVELPDDLYEQLTQETTHRQPGPPDAPEISDRYANKAFQGELKAVSEAPEGHRNDTLNTAAFNLGQLIGAGRLDRADVEQALLSATALPETEARRTIRSGLKSGMQQPRPAPASTAIAAPAPSKQPGTKPSVLTPGLHLDSNQEYHEIGNGDFARNVIRNLPPHSLYNRSGILGTLEGDPGERYFEPCSLGRMRVTVDDYIRLCKWVTKKKEDTSVLTYTPCTKDLASVLVDNATVSPLIPQLKIITNYPIYTSGWKQVEPGWHEGVYYDQPDELRGLRPIRDHETIQAILDNLLVDFPLKDSASKQNFYGLMLTPIIRSALNANIPMHLIGAPMERTGKTKLAEDVLGGVILGRPTPALQIGSTDEEIDKRILALLLRSDTIVHLDNVRGYLDSASLSSLLTATTYQGRVLGLTKTISLANHLTVVASGNNVRMSGELAKRTVPILLETTIEEPELRTDFQHPDLRGYVAEIRCEVLACLLGMVENWLDTDRPLNEQRMGGFDEWSRAVGGILRVNGYHDWRTNVRQWVRITDPASEDLHTFVAAWAKAYFLWEGATPRELLDIAQEADVFHHVFIRKSTHGQLMAFVRGVLARYTDRPVGEYVIRRQKKGSSAVYCLERREAEA